MKGGWATDSPKDKRKRLLVCFHSYTATTNEKFVGSSEFNRVDSIAQWVERQSRNPKVRVPARVNEFFVGGSSVRMKTN